MRKFSLLSVAALSVALLFVVCGKDSNSTGPSGGSGGGLVLRAGEAWVDDIMGITGYVFHSNGTYQTITGSGTSFIAIPVPLDYTLSGNKLTIPGLEYTFKVSGNTLTLTMAGVDIKYVKKTGLTIDGIISTPGNGGNPSGSLVCATGEAWVDSWPAGQRDGFVFRSGGVVQQIDDYSGYWEIYDVGTWTTSGNQLTMTFPILGFHRFTYSVSGNTLTLIDSDGDEEVYTKRTGINPVSAAPPESMPKSRAESKSRKALLLK